MHRITSQVAVRVVGVLAAVAVLFWGATRLVESF
jgi:hypothetical protein